MSSGQQDFVAIAIAAHAGEQFVGPCGACRFVPKHSLLPVEPAGFPCGACRFVPYDSLDRIHSHFELNRFSAPQAVHGWVQSWHSNLPCETWPGGSGLSFVLYFLEFKALSNVEKFKRKKAIDCCSRLETITQTINMLQIFDIHNAISYKLAQKICILQQIKFLTY